MELQSKMQEELAALLPSVLEKHLWEYRDRREKVIFSTILFIIVKKENT